MRIGDICSTASTRDARLRSLEGKALRWTGPQSSFRSGSYFSGTVSTQGASGRFRGSILARHEICNVFFSRLLQFCLSGSWDGTLRLWDLNTGTTTRRFVGHTKDVLSVAFSVDNRQVR